MIHTHLIKGWVVITLLIAVLGGHVIAHAAPLGTDWYVTTTGNDSNDCQSPATACRTIQAAVDKASAGDTVNVASGTYYEAVILKQGVDVIGADADTTTVDANGAQVAITGADDSLIQGFTVTGATTGIDCDGTSPTIQDNIIMGNSFGIETYHSSTEIAFNRLIDNTYQGIHTVGASDDYRLSPCSPAIDAGDPASAYANEPQPNGDRINMGAYGNTPEATVYDCSTPPENAIPAPTGTQPNGLAGDGAHLWMSSYMLNPGIYKLDPADGAVLSICKPPTAQYGGYGGLTFDGTYLSMAGRCVRWGDL